MHDTVYLGIYICVCTYDIAVSKHTRCKWSRVNVRSLIRVTNFHGTWRIMRSRTQVSGRNAAFEDWNSEDNRLRVAVEARSFPLARACQLSIRLSFSALSSTISSSRDIGETNWQPVSLEADVTAVAASTSRRHEMRSGEISFKT